MTGREYIQIRRQSPQMARRALFDEYYGYVYTIVCGRLSALAGREDIEECVSDVFAELFFELDGENAEKYSGELKGIAATVAKRRAIDRFRRLSRPKLSVLSLDDDSVPDMPGGDVPHEIAESEELSEVILSEIEALGEPDSTIIIQRYYYDRTSSEIAAALSMNGAAVRMRLSRALKKLRAALTKRGITL